MRRKRRLAGKTGNSHYSRFQRLVAPPERITLPMDLSAGDVIQFVLVHKWWFIALSPFVIAILVLKARG